MRAEGLVVRRGTATVLDRLDLTVPPGRVVAVRGASGAGKSTLLATLCGLLRPDLGSIVVAGKSLDGAGDRLRSRVRLGSVGSVFQGDELLPELTLAENVSLPVRLGPAASRPQDVAATVAGLLDRLGIGDLGARRPSEVSGGQLQRAAVARAVVHRPPLVLADEPTGSLDEDSARSSVLLLLELARENGSGVVVVTHDHATSAACDEQYVLEEGRLAPLPRSRSHP